MSRAMILPCVVLALVPTLVLGADSPAVAPKLPVATIVERNIAARGGLAAWQAVQTLSWSGKMDAGGNNQPRIRAPGAPAPPPVKDPGAQAQLPFVLEMKRGHKSRLELQFNGQTAVQVFDGSQGWKLRPFLNRSDAEPFTADELKTASQQAEFDGQLIGYAAKGTKIEVGDVEDVEGKAAYKLKLTLSDGRVMHDWVDAQSFLEVKIDGEPRRLDGRPRTVSVFMRDYRRVNGLQIPHLLETVVQGVQRTEKIHIEKVVVNPRLDDSRFAKPT